MIFLAHGIGGVRDLPVPESFFFTTAAIVLVVSFVLLGLLWKRPLLEAHAEGRLLPRVLSAFFLSTPLRVVLQLVSVFVFVVTLATALLGIDDGAPQLRADVRLRHLLAGSSAALGPLRKRVARAQPVARHRGRRRLAARARRPRGEARPPVERSLGPISGSRCALLICGARADESKTGLPSNARDRDGPLLVLGACGHGGVRSGSLVARRRRLRRDVPAVLAHRAVRRPRRSRVVVRWPFTGLAGSDRGRWSAAVRRRDDRLDELRRLLADRHVAEPHQRHPRGSRRLVSAHDRSRHDRRRTSRGWRSSSRRWRSRTSARSAPRLRSRTRRDGRSSRTSSCPSCRSQRRTWSRTTSRTSSSRASSSSRSRPIRSAAAGTLRDGRLRPEPRDRGSGHGLVRTGRSSRRRARRGSCDRARPRGDDVRGSGALLCARSIRCSR